MYISKITLYTFDTPRSYEEKLQEYSDKGYTYGNATIHIDAEMPESVSNYTIYPQNDRSSVITEPQNPTRIMRNIIGGDDWRSVLANGQSTPLPFRRAVPVFTVSLQDISRIFPTACLYREP